MNMRRQFTVVRRHNCVSKKHRVVVEVMPNRVCFGIAISRNARVAQVVAKLGFAGRPSRPKHEA